MCQSRLGKTHLGDQIGVCEVDLVVVGAWPPPINAPVALIPFPTPLEKKHSTLGKEAAEVETNRY